MYTAADLLKTISFDGRSYSDFSFTTAVREILGIFPRKAFLLL